MGIKLDETTKTFKVSYSKRHPITRQPVSRTRICSDKGAPIGTKAEAQRIFNQLVLEVESILKGPESSGKLLYSDLHKKFIESLRVRDISLKTIENYDLCLKVHTMPIWGKREIDTIATEEIRHLIKTKLADKSPSHQKNMLKFIRGIFNFAVESGSLSRNPTPKMQIRIGDKIKQVLTEKQLGIFLDKAKDFSHEWYPVWVMASYTGMRNGELHALTWDKVDLDNRKILVSSSWNKKDGLKDLTKSGEDRIVGVAFPLLAVLKDLKIKNDDSVYVLPRIHDWDVGRQAEILRQFLLGIGLPQIRFHDLRASWATVMLGKGVEPVKVMSMGGWKDLKTMMLYIRKAGIDIDGITDELDLHDPKKQQAVVLDFK